MRPEGTTDAARDLLLDADSNKDIRQVYQVTLRDIDRNDENPRVVTFIPIGSIIGIAVHRHDEQPKDSDIVFVAASAFGNVMPALGFTARAPVAVLVAPDNNA